MSKGEKLAEKIKEKGYNVNRLSKESGIAYSTIDSMIKRDLKNASIDNVLKICKILGISADDFEDLKPANNLYSINEDLINIPLLGEIACGNPLFVDENIEEYITEPKGFLPEGNLFYLKAKGNSMSPTIIDKSLVLIREQDAVENKEIAAVLMSGETEATLKRISIQDSKLMLVSDNPEFMPIIIDENNQARIIGKAISVRTNL